MKRSPNVPKNATPANLRLIGRLTLSSLIALLAACSDMHIVTPGTMIVEHPYTQHGGGNMEFPEGRYVAEFVDHRGTYYAAPTKIINRSHGMALADGGFLIPPGAGSPIHAFLINEETQKPYTIYGPVNGLSYHLEH